MEVRGMFDPDFKTTQLTAGNIRQMVIDHHRVMMKTYLETFLEPIMVNVEVDGKYCDVDIKDSLHAIDLCTYIGPINEGKSGNVSDEVGPIDEGTKIPTAISLILSDTEDDMSQLDEDVEEEEKSMNLLEDKRPYEEDIVNASIVESDNVGEFQEDVDKRKPPSLISIMAHEKIVFAMALSKKNEMSQLDKLSQHEEDVEEEPSNVGESKEEVDKRPPTSTVNIGALNDEHKTSQQEEDVEEVQSNLGETINIGALNEKDTRSQHENHVEEEPGLQEEEEGNEEP